MGEAEYLVRGKGYIKNLEDRRMSHITRRKAGAARCCRISLTSALGRRCAVVLLTSTDRAKSRVALLSCARVTTR